MPPQIAAAIFFAGIAGLLWLDRDKKALVSPALVLPFVWLWSTSSRSFTEWLAIIQTGRPPAATERAQMYLEGTPLDRNIAIALAVMALCVLIARRRSRTLLQANLPTVLFFLFAAASVVWSDFPDVTLRRWLKAVCCLLIFLVVLSDRNRDAAMRRLFVWTGFGLIPLSVLFIKYYPAIGQKYIIVNISTWELSPVGVATHKNSLGGICQVFGILFLWHFLSAFRNRQLPNRNRHLLAHGVALAMVAWLFLQANSVTAQSCFLLGAGVLVFASTRTASRNRWLVHALVFTVLAIPFAVLFLGVGSSVLQSMGRDSSLTGRTDIWPRVISLVDNPILGTGFESFWLGKRLETMQAYQRSLNEAHNGYIEIYATLGWIGVLLLLIMIAAGYRQITKCYKQNPNAGALRFAYFVTVIVSSFTEAAFRTESVSWIVFLLISMAVPEIRAREPVTELKRRTTESAVSRKEETVEATPVGTGVGAYQVCGSH